MTRHATFTWKAGASVYELVAPNCTAIFTMQSFYIGHPGDYGVQSEAELPTLASDGKINPPKGWVYRARTLQEDLIVEGVNGVTQVLSDEIGNSYSKLDEGSFDKTVTCVDNSGSGEDAGAEDSSLASSSRSNQSLSFLFGSVGFALFAIFAINF